MTPPAAPTVIRSIFTEKGGSAVVATAQLSYGTVAHVRESCVVGSTDALQGVVGVVTG